MEIRVVRDYATMLKTDRWNQKGQLTAAEISKKRKMIVSKGDVSQPSPEQGFFEGTTRGLSQPVGVETRW